MQAGPGTNERELTWLAVLFVLAGLGIRASGLSFVSFDMKDWLIGWYDQIATDGFRALREPFSNYTPPYLYLLALATTTASFLPKVAAIKLISIFFDLCNAFVVFRILKIKYAQGATALLGAAGFLLLPTIFLNSAFWGQADSVYTFFLLVCLYYLIMKQPLAAMIFLGIAFSFKALPIFLAPFLLLLAVRKHIPWWSFGIIPLVYALMMIPAWLTGRPFLDLMTIYLSQADEYNGLSMHAPTLYNFIPAEFYAPALWIGSVLTVLVIAFWVWVYTRKIKDFTPEVILLCALASAALVPFFLPKMHDRYFYLADVLSFLVAFYVPRLWYLAVGYQIVSGMAYSMFLLPSVLTIKRRAADTVLGSAGIVNTLVMGLLFWAQWREIRSINASARSKPT
ncbi:MAG TPA: hypothetical protein VGJ22_08005 [Anaerolineales bacterium]